MADRESRGRTERTPHPEPTRPSFGRRLLRKALTTLLVLVVLVGLVGLGGFLWLRGQARASLPRLDGEVRVTGLAGPVVVERDALGVPTIRGASRLDVARGTGFVHAQERFFQMDLMRRQSAGELSELVGRPALGADRSIRIHRFRHVARAVLERSIPDDRVILEAYTEGVNAGLRSLEAAPFEYLVLRTEPVDWRPEDSVLVLFSMFIVLQDEDGSREATLGVMRDVLPEPVFEFLTPSGTEWDAPIVGDPFVTPPVPGPDVFDLRSIGHEESAEPAAASGEPATDTAATGSNNWAVAREHSAHGGAILANDMHLGLTLPNTWYRASFVWPVDGEEHRVTGATLPGVPAMVVGSNGSVAWGFTNSYGDWSDLVIVEPVQEDPDAYLTPDGIREFERNEESIRIKGAEAETLEVRETVWGPIIGEDYAGRELALRWVAHDPDAVNIHLIRMETAEDIDESMRIASRSGIPAQNFVTVDASGRIGWTVMGFFPRRVGFDGRVPRSWSDGSRRWEGWLDPAELPRVIDPESGRLWTANNRVVGGEMLRKIGDGGYDLGARARQIRDRLFELERATESELLEIQLDDRALLLEQWRDLLLETLTPEAIADDPRRAEMRRLVEKTWTGRASVDSVGYRLVRGFRLFLSQQIVDAITSPCRAADPEFSFRWYRQAEGPVWRLVQERPIHLLDPKFETWDEQILSGVDETLDYFAQDETPLAERTWGQRNTVRLQHPLSRAVPQLSRWLDMPALQLPGDGHMPRLQSPFEGASQRMVVSPGREDQGFFHMPGGQSGHPLSPHYGDSHDAWAHGEPTPFLPGPAVHTVTLVPVE